MFDLLKRRAEPAVPFEFGYGVRIEKPAAEVYALLDWADPRNAKRALGNKVEQVGTSPDRFRMTLDIVPGHVFEMIVTEAVPGARYAFDKEITPPPGKLVASHERYTIEPAGETACVLTLRVFASFAPRLAEPAIAMEVAMMTTACRNALEKLRVQAEQGVEAVHAIEARQMDSLA